MDSEAFSSVRESWGQVGVGQYYYSIFPIPALEAQKYHSIMCLLPLE